MKLKVKALENQLEEVQGEIEEVLKRMPPHSAKPWIFQELEELEAKRDRLRVEIERLVFKGSSA